MSDILSMHAGTQSCQGETKDEDNTHWEYRGELRERIFGLRWYRENSQESHWGWGELEDKLSFELRAADKSEESLSCVPCRQTASCMPIDTTQQCCSLLVDVFLPNPAWSKAALHPQTAH